MESDEDADGDSVFDVSKHFFNFFLFLVLIFPDQATAAPLSPAIALPTSPAKHVNTESCPDIGMSGVFFFAFPH